MPGVIRFAHLSDWHATTLDGAGRELLQPKRLSGWASWKFSRRHRHASAILEAAIRDVHEQAVDRILVTGDLTHVSLEAEFKSAARQLASLGPAEQVCLIPGNHDCYVRVAAAESWDHWNRYLAGESNARVEARLGPAQPADSEGSASWVEDPEPGRAPVYEQYPRIWFEGRVAIIGLCSAVPMPTFRAGGRLGPSQLERLARLLRRLGELGFARIVLLHHPVIATDESARRALKDAEALRSVLEEQGAELVLHGHKHRRRMHRIEGPTGAIPIVGVPSSSEVGSRPEKQAQYHVYSFFEDEGQRGFRLEALVRSYDKDAQRFVESRDDLFSS